MKCVVTFFAVLTASASHSQALKDIKCIGEENIMDNDYEYLGMVLKMNGVEVAKRQLFLFAIVLRKL